MELININRFEKAVLESIADILCEDKDRLKLIVLYSGLKTILGDTAAWPDIDMIFQAILEDAVNTSSLPEYLSMFG